MIQHLENKSGAFCHADDILVRGKDHAEHDERLRIVLEKLKDSGITLNENKCLFSVKKIKLLGPIMNEEGMH